MTRSVVARLLLRVYALTAVADLWFNGAQVVGFALGALHVRVRHGRAQPGLGVAYRHTARPGRKTLAVIRPIALDYDIRFFVPVGASVRGVDHITGRPSIAAAPDHE